jgi:hypothetical protein
MKSRLLPRAILSLVVLLLAAGPGLASGSQQAAPLEPAGAGVGPTALGEWTIESVDGTAGVGSHVSISAGAPSYVWISYYNGSTHDLKRATFVGSGGDCGTDNMWQCETVTSEGDVGQYSSIETSRIAYFDATSSAVRFASKGLDWDFETIDLTQNGHVSMQIGDVPQVAYHYVQAGYVDGLKHAWKLYDTTGNCGAGGWQCEFVDSGTGVGQYPSLYLDSDRDPHIAYHHGATTGLRYAEKDGDTWSTREILPANSGYHASLAIERDDNDRPHIAHYNPSTGMLGYAVLVYTGGNCGFNSSSSEFEWQCDDIDSMGTDPHMRDVALTLDYLGSPVIAYHRYIVTDFFTIATVNVARPAGAVGLTSGNCGPGNTWHCERIPHFGHGGDHLAIDVVYRNVYVAFLDTEFLGSLRLARQTVGGWYLPLVSKSHAP